LKRRWRGSARRKRNLRPNRLWGIITAAAILSLAAGFARADTLEELRQAIEAKNEEIERLESEAKKFRGEITARQELAKTLSGELARIDRTIARLRREITVTERKISKKGLEIEALVLEIDDKRIAVQRLQSGLGAALRAVSERDEEDLAAVFLKHPRLSDFLRQMDELVNIQEKMLDSIDTLRRLRAELEAKKGEALEKKEELEDLKDELRDRRSIQEGEKRGRNELLTRTRNQEKEYHELLREREARRKALAEEIRGIEEKIRITIDPSLLPSKGGGVLGPPLPRIVLANCAKNVKEDPATNCLTQHFGYTSFAAVGGYNGKGHNGDDFRAEVGTPVFAADSGVVTAAGDTDSACRRASYGKWILIRHPNNLSTLYAHLSAIGVSAGQGVMRGDRIGHSGMSGYATGPHLHFSVFAAQAVRVENIRSRVCGRVMTIPISAINGYLNPLDYL